MENYRLKAFFFGLFLLLIFLQYQLWFGSNGLRTMTTLKKQLAIQTEENDKLKQRNQAILSEVEHLHNNKDAVESRARNELGLIKKGETFYQIVK